MKIAIIGPEATGKSQMAASLAKHYQTLWVPEYARSYLHSLGGPYTMADVLTIGEGQLACEKSVGSRAGLVFCDTDPLVIELWLEEKYCQVPWAWLRQVATTHYDAYLIMYPDLPYEFDPLRDAPDWALRYRYFKWFLSVLSYQKQPFHIVKGMGEARLQSAIKFVDSLLAR
jgi:nicotinamide riboside kinase